MNEYGRWPSEVKVVVVNWDWERGENEEGEEVVGED